MRARRSRVVFDNSAPRAEKPPRRSRWPVAPSPAPSLPPVAATAARVFLGSLLSIAFSSLSSKPRATLTARSVTVPCQALTFEAAFGLHAVSQGSKRVARWESTKDFMDALSIPYAWIAHVFGPSATASTYSDASSTRILSS